MNLIPADRMRHFFDDQVMPLLHKMAPYGTLGPRVEVRQTPDSVLVSAELPGIEHPEHLNIHVQETLITISGQIDQVDTKEDEHDMMYSERLYGKFSRTVPLPVIVDPEQVQADYRKGMLTVTMKKNTEIQGRQVPINFNH